jgi:glutaredoxin
VAALRRVVLYSRPICGLCDEARRVLLAARELIPFDLNEVNVESDDALEVEYGIRIPVIEIDGRERFEVTVQRDELLNALRGEGGSPGALVQS